MPPAFPGQRFLLILSGGFNTNCRDCGHIFVARPFGLLHSLWANCPRCYRLDLATWDPAYYRSTLWMRIRVFFGAHHWRCEPCRVNFVSFRPRKQRYLRPAPPGPPARDYEGAREL
jgi:hypothetical protein